MRLFFAIAFFLILAACSKKDNKEADAAIPSPIGKYAVVGDEATFDINPDSTVRVTTKKYVETLKYYQKGDSVFILTKEGLAMEYKIFPNGDLVAPFGTLRKIK